MCFPVGQARICNQQYLVRDNRARSFPTSRRELTLSNSPGTSAQYTAALHLFQKRHTQMSASCANASRAVFLEYKEAGCARKLQWRSAAA